MRTLDARRLRKAWDAAERRGMWPAPVMLDTANGPVLVALARSGHLHHWETDAVVGRLRGLPDVGLG
jgi:hypothetical protein